MRFMDRDQIALSQPHVILYMLRVAQENGLKFASAQMPLNVMDAHFRSFEKLVVPELGKQNIDVLGMRPMANGLILKSGIVTPIECLHYALSLPTLVVITGIDSIEILDQAFEAIRTFRPLTQAQRGHIHLIHRGSVPSQPRAF